MPVARITITPRYLKSQGLSPTFPERFWAKVSKNGPVPKHMKHLGKCWVWTACRFTTGYGWISASKKPGDKTFGIHAHVGSWLINFGPIPTGKCVLHDCDNKLCVNPKHLWIGTKKENTQDMISKGRLVIGKKYKGEENGSSKLTESQVKQIRGLRESGETIVSIGLKFGISHPLVSQICLRNIWKHI